MMPKFLKNEKDHQKALRMVESLWDAPKGSKQAVELDLWVSLVEAYEEKHHSIPAPAKGKFPISSKWLRKAVKEGRA